MPNIEWVRQKCLAMAGATEQVQWADDLIFKVGGKMFAGMPLEPGRGEHASWPWLSFKCAAEEFAELIERPGIRPAAYMARAQWVSLENEDALEAEEVERLLRRSYELVFAKLTKKAQAEILKMGAGKSRAKKNNRKKKKGRKKRSTRR